MLREGGEIRITSSETDAGEGLRGPACAGSCGAPAPPLLLLVLLVASMQLLCCALVLLLLLGASALLLSFTKKGGEPRLDDGEATAMKPKGPQGQDLNCCSQRPPQMPQKLNRR